MKIWFFEKISTLNKNECFDTDECADPTICQANAHCLNQQGHYECHCSEGYVNGTYEENMNLVFPGHQSIPDFSPIEYVCRGNWIYLWYIKFQHSLFYQIY